MLGLLRKARAKDELLEDLKLNYGLQWVLSDVDMISGSAAPKWWQGSVRGERFGIRPLGRQWEVYVGRIPSLLDLELARVGNRRPRPIDDSRLCIENFVPAGHPLALKFGISMIAHNDGRFHGAQLELPEVADELARFHDAVKVIVVYRWGIELDVHGAEWTRSDFDQDLSRAVTITRALQRFAADNPGHRT